MDEREDHRRRRGGVHGWRQWRAARRAALCALSLFDSDHYMRPAFNGPGC